MRKVESFNITSGKVIITDPCYDKDTFCQKRNVKAKNGKWYGEINLLNCDVWGERVQALIAYHNSCDISKYKGNDWKLISSKIGVDSGQAGIFDIIKYPDKEQDRASWGFFYEDCADNTLNRDFGSVEFGIVSSTGFGDGLYKAYGIRNSNKECVAIMIVFIEDKETSIDFMLKVCQAQTERRHNDL